MVCHRHPERCYNQPSQPLGLNISLRYHTLTCLDRSLDAPRGPHRFRLSSTVQGTPFRGPSHSSGLAGRRDPLPQVDFPYSPGPCRGRPALGAGPTPSGTPACPERKRTRPPDRAIRKRQPCLASTGICRGGTRSDVPLETRRVQSKVFPGIFTSVVHITGSDVLTCHRELSFIFIVAQLQISRPEFVLCPSDSKCSPPVHTAT